LESLRRQRKLQVHTATTSHACICAVLWQLHRPSVQWYVFQTHCLAKTYSLVGIGSDLLIKRFNLSRFWCLFASAVVFTLTQLAGATISHPDKLVVVSGFTGVAYGFLFGVFPSLVAHTFGIGGLSQNWGVMTLAPVVSGNVYNLLYGKFYDKHSVVGPDGDRECQDGLGCYQAAYYITFFSGVAGIVVCLWSVVHEKRLHGSVRKKMEHDRLA
jgi:hypothetical protein